LQLCLLNPLILPSIAALSSFQFFESRNCSTDTILSLDMPVMDWDVEMDDAAPAEEFDAPFDNPESGLMVRLPQRLLLAVASVDRPS
jgi:hypothetical protein